MLFIHKNLFIHIQIYIYIYKGNLLSQNRISRSFR